MELQHRITDYINDHEIEMIEFRINSVIVKISKEKISLYDIKKKKQYGLNRIFVNTKHICTYSPLCFGLEQINKSGIIFNKISYDDIVGNIEKIIY